MEDDRKWTAIAGRLDMKSFLYWVAIANALFILTVGLSALVVYVGMKLAFPFGVVRAVSILTFGLLIFLGGRTLKKVFDSKREDLSIEIVEESVIFSVQGKKVSETSIKDDFERLTGQGGEMGLGFPTSDRTIRVGCVHKTMAWIEGTQEPFQFELEPSDFIRLVGELGLEREVTSSSSTS